MKILSKKQTVFLTSFLLASMVLGSMYDYSFSQKIYDSKNIFGLFFAAYGPVPTGIALSFGGILLMYTTKKERSMETVLSYLVGIILNGVGIVLVVYGPHKYLPNIPFMIVVMIALLMLTAANWYLFSLIKDMKTKKIRQIMWFILFVAIGQAAVVNIIKIPWARPRMRFIAKYTEVSFQPWWAIGNSLRNHYIISGISSEEFKSFPSGHTASATVIFLLRLLPIMSQKWGNRKNLLFWIAFAYAVAVAVSRIMIGAHFISDVTIGFSVTIIVIQLSDRLFLRNLDA